MDTPPPTNSPKRRFWLAVGSLVVALLALAGLLWLLWQWDFGLTLFFAGLFTAFIGSLLAAPSPTDPANPRYSLKYLWPSSRRSRSPGQAVDYLHAAADFQLKHAAPQFSIENAVMVGGLLAMVCGVPGLLQIMFSK
jgi:hypothetical protein